MPYHLFILIVIGWLFSGMMISTVALLVPKPNGRFSLFREFVLWILSGPIAVVLWKTEKLQGKISCASFYKTVQKLFQCIFQWHPKCVLWRKTVSGDCIIALSFGLYEDNNPGVSNQALTYRMYEFLEVIHTEKLPLILQWEIHDVFKRYHSKMQNTVFRISEHREKGQNLDSLEVLLQAKKICNKNGFKKPILIAHWDHIWRVAKHAKKIGLNCLVVDMRHSVHPLIKKIYAVYDSSSIQKWTRDSFHWWMREIPARIHFLLKNKI